MKKQPKRAWSNKSGSYSQFNMCRIYRNESFDSFFFNTPKNILIKSREEEENNINNNNK